MIRSLIASALVAATASLDAVQAQAEESHTLTVKVSGLTPDQGTLYVGVSNTEENYRGFQFLEGQMVKVEGAETTISFTVPDGAYAMHVFQDLNGDGQPNFDAKGTPVEPIGASNNASMMYGPAQWSQANFEVTADVEQDVMLKTFGS